MELVPVYEDQPAGIPAHSSSRLPGEEAQREGIQQLAGVRVAAVERQAMRYTVRALGRVVPDETRVYRLNAGIDGYFRSVSPITTNHRVTKGQLLATFSGPSIDLLLQTFVLTLEGVERTRQHAASGSSEARSAEWNMQLRTAQLQNSGVPLPQIEELERTRRLPDGVQVLAPADGFLLARHASPGLKFDRGAEWFQIADLRRVWVLADVLQPDADHVRPGMAAQLRLPDRREILRAVVSDVLPQFEAATRAAKVRLEVDNREFVLRPDMLVDVDMRVVLPTALTVPREAILDYGKLQKVFVQREQGVFYARTVRTGWQVGDRVQVIEGLAPGERIAISGTFLLDSDSQLRGSKDHRLARDQ
jgi:Cu(I)/Ag(I) efflux system membrane fusion protein